MSVKFSGSRWNFTPEILFRNVEKGKQNLLLIFVTKFLHLIVLRPHILLPFFQNYLERFRGPVLQPSANNNLAILR